MKKWLSLLLVAAMAFTAPACAQEAAPDWINSNVIGNVTSDTQVSLTDDFHLAVNKDWLINAKIRPGQKRATTFHDRDKEVADQLKALIKGGELSSYEGQLVQRLYRDYTDIKRRNGLGMQPVMPYIETIREIETLDELTAYLVRDDQYSNQLLMLSVMADYTDSTINSVFIEPMPYMLGDSDEYKEMTPLGERAKKAYTPMLQKLLERSGFAPEDAARTIDDMFLIETELAKVSFGLSVRRLPDYYARIYNPVSAGELGELSPVFPIMAILKPYTDAGVERFIITDIVWLERLNELYTPENLEKFKALFICYTLYYAASYLDQEAVDIADEASSVNAGMPIVSDLEDDAFTLCSETLPMAVGKMFVDIMVHPETKRDVEGIIEDVVAVYKKRLENTAWMGEDTREKAIEKLDNLTVNVAYPDDWSIYDVSDIVFTDGMSLLEELIAINAHKSRDNVKIATEPVDPGRWFYMSPQEVNAFYYPGANSINIPAGVLGGVYYNAEGSIEENLGGIGTIIAHEITHGFDTAGSQFDKDGNMVNWWTEEDREAFTRRTDEVDAYFSSIEVLPGEYVDGQLSIGEAVADLGGLMCMLEMAKDIEGFDYAKLFTSYAEIWPTQMSYEVQQEYLRDEHPPAYLRTNVTVQQFEEFYEAFAVEEGDGMYLPPERRLSVW